MRHVAGFPDHITFYWTLSKLAHMRPVPTKWETSCKISFPSKNQIHVAQTLQLWNDILYVRVVALFGVQSPLFPWEILLFSIDFWNVQWIISPLVPWRLVAHFVKTGLILAPQSVYICMHRKEMTCMVHMHIVRESCIDVTTKLYTL